MDIDSIKQRIESEKDKVDSLERLQSFRVSVMGRKGLLSQLTSGISALPVEQRASYGKEVNSLKQSLQLFFEQKTREFTQQHGMESDKQVDMGLPGVRPEVGRMHPVTQVIDEICTLFVRMGFSVVDGPEIETEYNNFTGLNIPLEHPSRDAFDTFYLTSPDVGGTKNQEKAKLLLRSHTSPVQIRVMKSCRPPLSVVVPGRVYRPDATDASHSFMFHQIEGFMVDTDIQFSDLKGVLEFFAKGIFGRDITMRFRPHFFPFTEPSAEVDISCIMCKGKGCSVCGRKGWLEILGAGMIHPNVFRQVGYDSTRYTGFAFGMGVERIAMLKYGISDIRLFFENDLRFLTQF